MIIQSTISSPPPVLIGGLFSDQWMQPKRPIHKTSPPIARLQADSTPQVGSGSRFYSPMTKNYKDANEIHPIKLVSRIAKETTRTNPITNKEKRK